MKKAVFKKPFSDYSANKGFLSNLLTKEGYDKDKINHHLNMIKKGLRGESELNYYLSNTYKEIYCLHDIRIQNGKQKSQMDFIIITRNCIWVLESKSLSGHITVCEDGKIIRDDGSSIKNPIIQAKIQANNLKELLIKRNLIKEHIEVKYKIVFTDNSENTTVSYNSDEIKKHFIDVELISTLFEEEIEEKLSKSDVEDISNFLIFGTKFIPDTPIKDSDYLLKNYNNQNTNKQNPNKQNQKNHKKKKSNITSVLLVTIFLFFIWFKYVSPIVDQTMSVLDMPTEQLTNGLTEEQIALGEQRYIVKKLPQPVGTSQQVEQTAEVILIANNMTKEELISILKTNYSDKYDYVKITITTNKTLFDHYNYITIGQPDNLEELEKGYLIGYYIKNNCFNSIDEYGKDRIKFVQKTGSFAELYNQYIDIN